MCPTRTRGTEGEKKDRSKHRFPCHLFLVEGDLIYGPKCTVSGDSFILLNLDGKCPVYKGRQVLVRKGLLYSVDGAPDAHSNLESLTTTFLGWKWKSLDRQ